MVKQWQQRGVCEVRCKMLNTNKHKSIDREQTQGKQFVACTRAYITKNIRRYETKRNKINLLGYILY